MAKKISDTVLVAVIMAVVLLEVAAMFYGINGWLLRIVIGGLLFMGGVRITTPEFMRRA